MNLEKITWDDAGAFGDPDGSPWRTLDEIIDSYHHANFTVVSVGYVIHENADSIIVAQSYDNQYEQYSTTFRIPKGMVKERVAL